MDPIGTIALPLLQIVLTMAGYLQLAGFIIGWGKPVPVNYHNLRNVDRDSVLVAMAGPAMNVFLTIVVMMLVKVAGLWRLTPLSEAGLLLAEISMALFFFNLIPVPPLDGSHILRVITRMKWETFFHMSRFGFLIVILLINFVQPVRDYIYHSTAHSILSLAQLLNIDSNY